MNFGNEIMMLLTSCDGKKMAEKRENFGKKLFTSLFPVYPCQILVSSHKNRFRVNKSSCYLHRDRANCAMVSMAMEETAAPKSRSIFSIVSWVS